MLLSLSFPLHCVLRAAQVGATALAGGAAFGTCLAGITRTRRVGRIYLFLAGAALALASLFVNWPPAESTDLTLWRGAPDLLSNYFDILRPTLFLLALPYPFAALGHHGLDAN